MGWETHLFLNEGKVGGRWTNSPGVNSGNVKIPANQLLFGQRKTKQRLWLISPGIGGAGWLFWHLRKPAWMGAGLGDLYLCQHGFWTVPAPAALLSSWLGLPLGSVCTEFPNSFNSNLHPSSCLHICSHLAFCLPVTDCIRFSGRREFPLDSVPRIG